MEYVIISNYVTLARKNKIEMKENFLPACEFFKYGFLLILYEKMGHVADSVFSLSISASSKKMAREQIKIHCLP